MKRIVIIALLAAIACSCGHRSNKRIPSSASAEPLSVNIADSVLFERHWNNPEYYVFDRPSDKKIKEWQAACEELDWRYNRLYVPAYMDSLMIPYLAYSDWFEVCCSMEGIKRGYNEDREFVLWRMNEMLPSEGEIKGEVERYDFFCRQADIIGNSWTSGYGGQWDYNFGSAMNRMIAEIEGKIYAERIRKELPSISNVLEMEERAYDAFYSAVYDTFEKTQMSPDGDNGSAAMMAYASIQEEVAVQRNRSIVPFYLAVTDPENVKAPERHALITDRMLSDEYDSFFRSLEQSDYAYPIEEQRTALKAERKAWDRWMDMRAKVSSRLQGAGKDAWDNCTNNLKRSHLIALKNRYTGHGMCSESEIDALILDSCSDKVLFGDSYDAVDKHAGSNPFVFPETDGLEASTDSLTSFVSKTVDLGGTVGKAKIAIENVDSLGLMPTLIIKGREYPLSPHNCIFSTISLLDLDGDGLKEVLVHDGDLFSLMVYSMTGGEPKQLGVMECNNGFWLTDDGILFARLGTQGLGSMACLVDGELRILEDDGIDKLMFSSKEYSNLRYVFDDTSDQDRTLERIYSADEYIICDQGSIFGDHAFSTDLDGDGKKEQLYLGRPGWGMQQFDIMRVIIPGTRTSYDLASDVFQTDGVRGVKKSEFDCEFSGTVQLSAKDVNGDGRKEIIATVGEDGHWANFIWSFERNTGVSLISKVL